MGEEDLVGKLLLVLLPDTVVGFMVPHCMLKQHDFDGLFHLPVKELTIVDQGVDSCASCHLATVAYLRGAHLRSAKSALQT